ncbi:longitudinals lacking protein, isoforms A/B/D/L [Nasonia vitripennis]|uniref:C2H2-type domain-containing protein n=1 Tax=Nasonia vitripennis TaxID=7425 RepID=A0A7M7IRF9_NASVI|nr:longitudinals lacking protein, isoforms A/B/D/L [Nasonia vitripennis]
MFTRIRCKTDTLFIPCDDIPETLAESPELHFSIVSTESLCGDGKKLESSVNQCEKCGKSYKRHCSLIRHKKYECDQPPRFKCRYCEYWAKYRTHLLTHIAHRHKGKLKDVDY